MVATSKCTDTHICVYNVDTTDLVRWVKSFPRGGIQDPCFPQPGPPLDRLHCFECTSGAVPTAKRRGAVGLAAFQLWLLWGGGTSKLHVRKVWESRSSPGASDAGKKNAPILDCRHTPMVHLPGTTETYQVGRSRDQIAAD